MPWFDFQCTNCDEIVKDEPFSSNDEKEGRVVKCPKCGSDMQKLLGGMKEKHGSWAEWRLSLGNVD